jgi:hypothetical protein
MTADRQVLETAAALIAAATYSYTQENVSTEDAVKIWLSTQINSLPGMSETGLLFTVYEININSFSSATAGSSFTPSGTDGSFTFTVSLVKGATSLVTPPKIGTITATPFTTIPPVTTYAIQYGTMSNGTVIASPASTAEVGSTVVLTVIPATDYELETLTVDNNIVTAGVFNNRYSFTMPSHDVRITATFRTTQERINSDVLDDLKTLIENGTYRIAQATGNTNTSITTWLTGALQMLFGQSTSIRVRSTDGIETDAVVTVKSITEATSGTETYPTGTQGSFRFTVLLTRNEVSLETSEVTGVIVATPHAAIPVKAIELLKLGATTVRILNTGNVSTGDLTLNLTGNNADVFILSTVTPGDLSVGAEANIIISTQSDLAIGVYTATLTASGEGITPVSVALTHTVTSTDNSTVAATDVLRAVTTVGGLRITGLIAGEALTIYNMQGNIIYTGKATSTEEFFPLREHGVYVVVAGRRTVKAAY